jgi:predicted HicB family RNase H-like nuclease
MAKRKGRPPKNAADKKRGYLQVRVDHAEKQAFHAAARLAGLDLSAWVRERLRQVARGELDSAGLSTPFIGKSGE